MAEAPQKRGWRDALDWRDILFFVGGAAAETGLFMLDPRYAVVGAGALLLFLSLWRVN